MSTKIVELSSSTKFDWWIENFSKLNSHQGVYSDVFTVGAFKWRAKIYPKGFGKVYDHLSLFLCPVELTKAKPMKYSFAITSRTKNTIRKEEVHLFKVGGCEHGWIEFMRLDEFHDPDKGYISQDGTCFISVEVSSLTMYQLVCKLMEPDQVIEVAEE